jgi:hypothetical protein
VKDHGLVLLIRDAKALLEARLLGKLAQQRQAEGVDRAAADVVREPRCDLFSGAIGEGDGANASRIEPLADEMLDTGDETEGLSGAGPCDDEGGAEGRFDRASLLGQSD